MKKWENYEIEELKNLLLKGYTYKDISIKLYRSVKSVKTKAFVLGVSYQEIQLKHRFKYENIKCKNCNNEFESLKSLNSKFCSKTCAASYNNIGRNNKSDKVKIANCVSCNAQIEVNIRASNSKCLSCKNKHNKTRKTDKCNNKHNKNKTRKPCKTENCNNIPGKHKQYCESCKTTKAKRAYKNYKTRKPCKTENCNNIPGKHKQYCESCAFNYYKIYRPKCEFNFNIYDYPEQFNIKLVESDGWYSPANKSNNLNGVSRDHRYSVRDGFDNNINPEIISHPANCMLMLHCENNKKNKKSSITIEELLLRINNWDKKYK